MKLHPLQILWTIFLCCVFGFFIGAAANLFGLGFWPWFGWIASVGSACLLFFQWIVGSALG